MYKCIDCGYRGPEVAKSTTFNCYLCDSCFTDRNDAREDEIIDACHSNGEQEF